MSDEKESKPDEGITREVMVRQVKIHRVPEGLTKKANQPLFGMGAVMSLNLVLRCEVPVRKAEMIEPFEKTALCDEIRGKIADQLMIPVHGRIRAVAVALRDAFAKEAGKEGTLVESDDVLRAFDGLIKEIDR